MANIMITKRCNLRCAYCFANEFVGDVDSVKGGDGDKNNVGSGITDRDGVDSKEGMNSEMDSDEGMDSADMCLDISMESFREILDFILGDGSVTKLGLIGGEPTLHPSFGEMLDLLIQEERAEAVTIYTNGTALAPYLEQLSHPKFHLLVNCNDLTGQELLFKRFMESLEGAFAKLPDRIILGANYYKPDYDYRYLCRLIERFACRRLRLSISVPNTEEYVYEPLDYFRQMKPKIFGFFRTMKELGTVPFLDCNIFPACLVTADEMEEFAEWGCDNPLSVLKNHRTGCMPVIDILPDGTAVRCFGLSEYTKAQIRDFASVSDLRNYYMRTVDAYAVNCYYHEQCTGCYKYKTAKCYGGCLIYKIDQILEMRNTAEEMNKKKRK